MIQDPGDSCRRPAAQLTTGYRAGPSPRWPAVTGILPQAIDAGGCWRPDGLPGRSGRRTAPDGTVSAGAGRDSATAGQFGRGQGEGRPASDRLADQTGPCPRPEPAQCYRGARARAAPAGVRPLPPGGVVLSFRVNPGKYRPGELPGRAHGPRHRSPDSAWRRTVTLVTTLPTIGRISRGSRSQRL